MVRLAALLTVGLCGSLATSRAFACVGDCNEDGSVTIDELILCTDIALRAGSVETCPLADANEDDRLAIDEIVQAVDNTLNGCPTTSIPTSGPEMLAWLQAGNYLDWAHESALHRSQGPHAQQVLTYFNEPLLASLAAGNATHPAGAASVKELFNRDSELVGWAVMVKAQDDSDGGNGWYWYEGFGTSFPYSAFGHPACTGCHSSDQGTLTSKDFVLSPYPPQ
jgi:hypothetical protein